MRHRACRAKRALRLVLAVTAMASPSPVRHWILARLLGHRIARTARVGFSLVDVDRLVLGPGATIGSLNVVRGLRVARLDPEARIGTMNWISASPRVSGLFPHAPGRRPALWLREGSAITRRHLLDVSDQIVLDPFCILAGSGSEILTHAIDLDAGEQRTARVRIGARSFVGTRAILLAGARVPDRCVVAAGAVVTGPLAASLTLYGGVPARPLGPLRADAGFFTRRDAHVR